MGRITGTRWLAFSVVGLISAVLALGTVGQEGVWWGEVRLPTGGALYFEFDADAGTLSIPQQGMAGRSVSGVLRGEDELRFTLAVGPNEVTHAKFHVEFVPGADGTSDAAVGTLFQNSVWMVTRMARGELADPPAVEALPSRRDLDVMRGAVFWSGVMNAAGQELKFALTVRRDATGEPVAVLDIPAQGVASARLVDVAVEGEDLSFTLVNPGPASNSARFSVRLTGETAAGVCEQAGQSWPVTMTRVGSLRAALAAAEAARPQMPTGPRPYREEAVSFEVPADGGDGVAGGGHEMGGTLTLPDAEEYGEGPYTAVVLVSGSGQQDRDETIAGHKPFLVIADRLTRRGIAVLRYDDRGVGASGGDPAASDTFDFADDCRAAVAFLEAREDIGRIGIVGHSEGGLIAPIVASDSEVVDFIALLAGMGLSGRDTVLTQSISIAVAEGVDPELAERANVPRRKLLDALASDASDEEVLALVDELVGVELERQGMGGDPAVREVQVDQAFAVVTSPWYSRLVAIDPAVFLREVDVPVLVMQGEMDTQVLPDEHVGAITAALAAGGNEAVTVKRYAGLNHLFQPSETGAMSEYGSIEVTFDEGVIDDLGDWVLGR